MRCPRPTEFGTTNTLNAGDNFGTTGLTDAKDQGTLNYTADREYWGNQPLATNVTMSGVSTANITNATARRESPASPATSQA